jgi:predicted 3-demethylubiquinone-9 3-methyltransferase (glyoxalase superfamily)
MRVGICSAASPAPFLWFDNQAEDAVNFYLAIFKNSRRLEVVHNNGNRPAPASVLTIAFLARRPEIRSSQPRPKVQMQAMLKMKKLDIAELERAAES